ncbi:blue copper protein 1b-like [Andrographis paniculata]|uniref:blue copper protein 1b-like n=1 Tax=Andrographis paniculata TaxID=175694 RepID=UPI0021E92DE6|nr:blue copper protein 1b-like [Andrographis paniculata]
MGCKLFLVAAAVVCIAAAAQTQATDYIVGDYAGWKLGFDYAAWAQGKQFFLGDRLVFKYKAGAHNVYKVNGTAFQSCTVPPLSEALSTGNDVITLATVGRKWYICGVGNHCASGMKLVITVAPYPAAPSPAPAPAPAIGAKKPIGIWKNWKLKMHF